MTNKEEKTYRNFFHDVSNITRAYIDKLGQSEYPQMRPGFRGYLVRELQKLGYGKIKLRLGNIALIED